MPTVIYKERQRYHDWFTIAALVLGTAVLIYVTVMSYWREDLTLLYALLALTTAAALGVAAWWLYSLRSRLVVTTNKIKYKVFGPVKTKVKISWEDVESCRIVRTAPHLKWSRPKITLSDERYHSLNGRNGLSVKTTDGEHYFIGCRDIGSLREALAEVGVVNGQMATVGV